MCGFVGRYIQHGLPAAHSSVDSALELLKHRGPDSSGISTFQVRSGTLKFGFRRLSIIDLSEAANQPFTSSDERYSVVFNGEIFNYIELKSQLKSKGYFFRTDSDTEVLLTAWQEWGLGSLNKFVGMFAFVIFDKLKSEMWCVRDPYGIKPFFYSHSGQEFAFASEISALNRLRGNSPRVDEQIALKYLIDGEYDRSVNTFFREVLQIQPGHFLKVDLSEENLELSQKRWWFPSIETNTEISFSDAAEVIRHEFIESVSIHLRSDVKVATALSGGLDSSAIVSVIRKIYPDIEINTFSYLASDSKINERQWVDKVNISTNAIPHFIEITKSEFLDDLDDLIKSQGEPFGSTSLYAQYRIYKAAKQSGVTVMLDGQGADELLAGYFGYPENRIHSLLETKSYLQAASFIAAWSKWPGRDASYLLRSSTKQLVPMHIQNFLNSAIKRSSFPSFISKGYLDQNSFVDVFDSDVWSGRRLSQRLLKEQSNGELNSLLRHADRNSMRWSIESRVPFLNPKLSEFVLSLPEHYLISNSGETKSVFREAMRGILNQEVIDRKDKIGFATPQDSWVSKEILLASPFLDTVDSFGFLNAKNMKTFFKSDSVSNMSQKNLTWRLFNFIKWAQLLDVKS
jgi:asparagine synthase (glutamine-hydrolysing)